LAEQQLIPELRDYLVNARVVRTARQYATLLSDYITSGQESGRGDAAFASVHTFVIFLGIGRSGTTLLGALLDAHPNMVIARQQNIFKYLYPFSFSRERIFRLLVKNAFDQASGGNPGGGGYTYAVAGQFQGNSDRIEVIGDKSMAAQSVEWLTARPELIERLIGTIKTRVKILHVIRNPFDTIARRSLRRRVSLEKISREYFALSHQMRGLFTRIESNGTLQVGRIPLHLEDLIRSPEEELSKICESLGVQPLPSYLEACSGIVHAKPRLAREEVSWPVPLIREIQLETESLPWLKRYSFDDA